MLWLPLPRLLHTLGNLSSWIFTAGHITFCIVHYFVTPRTFIKEFSLDDLEVTQEFVIMRDCCTRLLWEKKAMQAMILKISIQKHITVYVVLPVWVETSKGKIYKWSTMPGCIHKKTFVISVLWDYRGPYSDRLQTSTIMYTGCRHSVHEKAEDKPVHTM